MTPAAVVVADDDDEDDNVVFVEGGLVVKVVVVVPDRFKFWGCSSGSHLFGLLDSTRMALVLSRTPHRNENQSNRS